MPPSRRSNLLPILATTLFLTYVVAEELEKRQRWCPPGSYADGNGNCRTSNGGYVSWRPFNNNQPVPVGPHNNNNNNNGPYIQTGAGGNGYTTSNNPRQFFNGDRHSLNPFRGMRGAIPFI